MPPRARLSSRPTGQLLEHRRCLAAALGMDDVAATPTEPADQAAEVGTLTITDTTISGNTANGEGGGILDLGLKENVVSSEGDTTVAYDPTFWGGVRVAAGDVSGDGIADIITSAGPGGGPHVKVFDGASNALRDGDDENEIAATSADLAFRELGRDASADSVPLDSFSLNFAKIE